MDDVQRWTRYIRNIMIVLSLIIVVFLFFAADAIYDTQAIKKSGTYCKGTGLKKVDTSGFFSVNIICDGDS